MAGHDATAAADPSPSVSTPPSKASQSEETPAGPPASITPDAKPVADGNTADVAQQVGDSAVKDDKKHRKDWAAFMRTLADPAGGGKSRSEKCPAQVPGPQT